MSQGLNYRRGNWGSDDWREWMIYPKPHNTEPRGRGLFAIEVCATYTASSLQWKKKVQKLGPWVGLHGLQEHSLSSVPRVGKDL